MINDSYLRSSRIVNFSHKLVERFYYTTKIEIYMRFLIVQGEGGGCARRCAMKISGKVLKYLQGALIQSL